MAQLKDIFKVTQSQYNTLMDGGTVGSHTYDSNAIYLVEGGSTLSTATDSALGGIKIGYTSTENNRAVLLDSNDKAYIALPSRLHAGRTDSTSPDSATNSGFYYSSAFPESVGFGSNQGTMFVSSYDSGWVAQIAIGRYTNKMIFRKKGNGWSNWETVATESWVTDQLSDIDVDVDLSNYVDKTTTQTITGAKTFTGGLTTNTITLTSTNGIAYSDGTNKINMIKFITGGSSGHGIVIGGNGSVVIGAGESASNITTALGIGGNTEYLYLSSDQEIEFYSNCNASSAGNRKQSIYRNSGDLDICGKVISQGLTIADGEGLSSRTKRATWQYNSSTDCVELVW